MEPIVEAQKWVVAMIRANDDIEAPIHDDPAPSNAPYPFIVMRFQGGSALLGNSAHIIWDDVLMLIEAYTDSGDITEVSPIVSEIRGTIHGQFGTTSEARIVSCIYESPFKASESVEGVDLLRLGGNYRLKVQEL